MFMDKQRILFKGGTILPMDGRSVDLQSGDLLVVGDRIAGIAPSIAVDDALVIDASGTVICPGFVDTHQHADHPPHHGHQGKLPHDGVFIDACVRLIQLSLLCVHRAPFMYRRQCRPRGRGSG